MEINIETSVYAQKAMELFKEGFNCSQSVFLAFADMYEMDYKTVLRLSSSFGGGMGRLREVCGAVSGMFLVAGVLYGYSDLEDSKAKSAHYKRIRTLAARFNELHPSIVCRDILGAEAQKGGQCGGHGSLFAGMHDGFSLYIDF